MLPNPHNPPIGGSQTMVCVSISPLVVLQLLSPEIRIRLRSRRMLWTAMPEAAVYEHSNLHRPEDNVCLAADARYDAAMNAKPQTEAM
jgi:hypothetical protein